MKYKVGDKVRIKSSSELVALNAIQSVAYYVNEDMLYFSGKVCTISEVYDDCYLLKEDEQDWYWTDEMIDHKICFETQKDDEPKTAMEVEERNQWLRTRMEALYRNVTYGAFGDQREENKEIKEIKEDIKMSNTDLIEIKENEEERALDKAEREELKNKFYETPIGKAAKAFNEALTQYGSDEQKQNYMIDEDELLDDEAKEYIHEIGDKYDAKRTEIRQYYLEAKNLFENADTYEQKHEILTSYGILKGPKTKAKVEVK